jgi:hypothetical protein
MEFLRQQLAATMTRHNDLGDTIILTLAEGVVVTALREFEYEDATPDLGGVNTGKKIQLRFPASELGQAMLHQDFEIGDRCYIDGPIQLQPSGTKDDTKWELKYFRASADGLLISVGLGSND